MDLGKGFPQCSDCLRGLARSAAKLAAGGSRELEERCFRAARQKVEEHLGQGLSSPQIANRVLEAVTRISGSQDPFAEFKQEELRQGRKALDKVAHLGRGGLKERLILAALGNSLDFFKDPAEALAELEGLARGKMDFFRDDSERLAGRLEARPKLALYLTDNTGEIYFDLPLYEYLAERAERVVLVVKGGPALNDLTRAELEDSGLAGRVKQVADTGYAGVGVDWERVSDRFRGLLTRADLVLAKGMANFETLYPRTLDSPVLFLFKLKCRPLRDYLSAPGESYWALWKEAGPGRELF